MTSSNIDAQSLSKRAQHSLELSRETLNSTVAGSKILDDLDEKFESEKKLKNKIDLLSEYGVAAWLATKEKFGHRERQKNAGDPVVDFTLASENGEFGVEVKSNRQAIKSEILDGRHPDDDLAVRPLIIDKFGEDHLVSIEWLTDRPIPESWGKMHESVLQNLRGKIEELSLSEPPVSINVSSTPDNESSAAVRFNLKIFRESELTVEWHEPGEGWGYVVDRVLKHAATKADKQNEPFVLVYHHLDFMKPVVTPSRLAWAWDEIISKAPNLLRGVIILEQSTDEFEFSATGKVNGPISPQIPIQSLPSTIPDKVVAQNAWENLKAELKELECVSESIAEISERIQSVSCHDKDALEIYERAVVETSNAGRKLKQKRVFGTYNSPLPCKPSQLLRPEYRVPDRRAPE